MPYRFRFPSPSLLATAALLSATAAVPALAQTPTPARFNLNAAGSHSPAPAATPVDTRFQPPKVLKRGAVVYPILANLNRIEGVVGVRFFVDEAGKVSNAIAIRSSRSVILDGVVKSNGILDWTFQPATLDGKPVPGTLDQEIEFRLDPAEQRHLALTRLATSIGQPDPPYPPEGLAMKPRPHGDCTVGVFWTDRGLVDLINLVKSSGSVTLDHAALRFAYEHWRVDPKLIKDPKVQFTKVVTFTPPDDATGTPPPLATAAPSTTPKRTP